MTTARDICDAILIWGRPRTRLRQFWGVRMFYEFDTPMGVLVMQVVKQ